MGRKVTLIKNTPNFSSWVGKGIVRIESPFQGYDIVFRRSGIMRNNCPFGALELWSREERSIVSGESN
jgi:hypothetical protein